MMAIPKSLLIHQAIFHRKISEGRWGKEQTDEGQTLLNIRIEPSSKIVRDKNNAEVKLSALMFYDCKNSKPKGIAFEKDDIIIFQGLKHKIEIVEPLYDEKKLHHYELGLIKHA